MVDINFEEDIEDIEPNFNGRGVIDLEGLKGYITDYEWLKKKKVVDKWRDTQN